MADETEYLFDEFQNSAIRCEAPAHAQGGMGCDPTEAASYYLVLFHTHTTTYRVHPVCRSHVIWRRFRQDFVVPCQTCKQVFLAKELWALEAIIDRKATK